MKSQQKSNTNPATTTIANRISRSQCEILLAQVADIYQNYYDNHCIKAQVQVIPSSLRFMYNNSNIVIKFMNNAMGHTYFYHKAFFSTPNKNGTTWNSEPIGTYGKHDSISIHVVDNLQNLQMKFQYIMTSSDLQIYFPNVSTNHYVHFKFPATNPPSPVDNCCSSHINDLDVLLKHFHNYLNRLSTYELRMQAQQFSSHVRHVLSQKII